MADGAAHLTDHVMPFAPYRQWTLSLPYRVRYMIGQDRQLLSRTLTLFLRTVFNWQRKTARRHGVKKPLTGAVTFCQRIGSLLQFTPHFHSWIADGTWSLTAQGTLEFHQLPPPEDQEVEEILYRSGRKVQALMAQAQEEPPDLADEEASLAQSQAWAIQLPISPAPSAAAESEPPKKRRCAFIEGYSLHADVSVKKNERQKLERLLRYGLRPAFSQKRLSITASGQVRLKLRKPLRSGAQVLHFAPLDFLRRFLAAIPPKRMNVVRFHGIFAPNAKVRSQVNDLLQEELQRRQPPAEAAPKDEETNEPNQPVQNQLALLPPDQENSANCPDEPLSPVPLPPQYRRPWHELLKRVFGLEVLQCGRCGARMKRISHIDDPGVIAKILRHLGLPTSVPEAAPARAPPQVSLEDTLFVLDCPRCGAKMKRISHIEDPAVIEKILRHLHLPTTVPEAAPARAPPQLLLEDAVFADDLPEASFGEDSFE